MKCSAIIAMLVIAGTAPATAAEQTPIPGTLTRFVPADVWLIAGHVHTADRDFVREHWTRVYNAFCACGIDRELRAGIAAGLPECDRADFLRTWDTFADAFRSIEWRDLGAQEFVFAERITSLFPDFMLLMRPSPQTLEANVKGLAEVLRTLASFSKSGDLTFSEQTVHGVRVWALDAKNAPVGASLLHKDDVIAVVIGQAGRSDVLALLAGDGTAKSLADSPRLRAAFAEVPAPGYAYAFLDFARLFEVIPSYPKMIAEINRAAQPEQAQSPSPEASSNGEAAPQAEVWMRFFSTALDHLDVLDYVVISNTMQEQQEYAHTVTKAKVSALNKPVYRMVANRQPIDNFHRYLPVECTSYAVSTFIDLGELYRLTLELLHDHLPGGELVCAKWAQFQRDADFDVEEDLLSWLGGEVISFTLPSETPTPFGGEDGATLIRVTDRDKARRKVATGLDRIAKRLGDHGQPFQMMPSDVPAEGFRKINYPLLAAFGIQPEIGVWEDWLVFGLNEYAVRTMMATADGKHDSILKNPRFRAEGLAADGPVCSATFSDLTRTGDELTAMLLAFGFAAGSMPDRPETRPVRAILRSISSLGPVVNEINFFSSKSCTTTFADGVWRSTAKITYKPARKTAQSAP
jgi:hypothetical protein